MPCNAPRSAGTKLPLPLQILPGVGLCICVYELTEVGDAIIIPGDGCAYTEGACGEPGAPRRAQAHTAPAAHRPVAVTFQLVIFRPMEDEVLTGTIKAWNHQGLQVSLIFFEDIFIPASMMMEGSQLCVRRVRRFSAKRA